jgi:ABC-2 type transport system permease protein
MFASIAVFEIRFLLRGPVFWVSCAIFFLLAFGATTMQEIQIGSRGNVNVNAPAAILEVLGVMSVFGMFVATAFVAGAVIRDDETGFAPILRATRVGKAAYVFGRFAGATVVAFIVLASVALGIFIGSFMPWVDPSKLGPLVPGHYLWALFVFLLPTVLVISAVFFALAVATRSLMWTYIGAVAALVGFIVSRVLLQDPSFDRIAALFDPFGLGALRLATKYWTATERNTQLPGLEGVLLANRALWFAVAAVMLAVAYRAFRMDGRPLWSRAGKKASAAQALAEQAVPARAAGASGTLPAARHSAAVWPAFVAMARLDAKMVFRSPAFVVLMALAVVNAFVGLWFASRLYGTEIFPVTRVMVQALEGSFSLFQIIIAVFYAGELVWRDRQTRLHEIVDATPAPDWVHLLPKIAAIVGVLLLTSLAGVATAMFVQVLRGYTAFEFGHYLLWFVLPQTVSAALLAVLAVFVQTLVPNKMLGWAAMLVYVVATIALGAVGFEHNLYVYGNAPGVPLSDMNGQGHFWIGRAWFLAYWCAFALMLVVLAYLLRRRGPVDGLRPRLVALPARLRSRAGAVLGAATLAWGALGGWIFYNTNVLNEYVTTPDAEAAMARYERELLPFEALPQPTITDVTLDVALYPRERRAVTQGSYVIENRTGAPLERVHVRWVKPLKLTTLELPGATMEKEYTEHAYRIYRFAPALAPGDKRMLTFATELAEVGFRNDAGPRRLVDNGSFLNNVEVTPLIGMDRSQLLQDRVKRRKHGLPPELRMAKLEDAAASRRHYLRGDSDWVNARITLSTDADQVPVAPGAPLSDSTANGRRTLVTRTEAPIQHFFSLQSGRYAVREKQHGATLLRVYHHPGHDYNVQRMLDAMAASIDLFSREFSPYQFKHARVLEFPAYADFAQAFAGTMPYSEGIGFVMRHREDQADEKIDMVTYITAHEVAHQWWAHQVIGADKQGSTLLSETFAQYSALLVMEKLHGRDQIRKFLKWELDRYLRARGGELIEELPLARVENQPYVHYQKGSLAMYWLRDVAGEAAVNRALKRLLEQHAFKPAPYPSSTDFLRLLREEAGPKHEGLIADLFERIVLVDAKLTEAKAKPLAGGRWEVLLDVQARKLVADGKGVETETPMDGEVFDIGVFSAEPGKKGFTPASVLAMERRPVASGAQQIRVVVDREPTWAGIDPYNKRIDRNGDDNVRAVGR